MWHLATFKHQYSSNSPMLAKYPKWTPMVHLSWNHEDYNGILNTDSLHLEWPIGKFPSSASELCKFETLDWARNKAGHRQAPKYSAFIIKCSLEEYNTSSIVDKTPTRRSWVPKRLSMGVPLILKVWNLHWQNKRYTYSFNNSVTNARLK
jgi:hypothetical protein